MQHTITKGSELEALLGKANPLVHLKSIDHLDPGALGWIAASPLMFACFGDTSGVEVTLGGGAPAWVSASAHELYLPTLLLDAPELADAGKSFGSFFMIPSISEILRVNGKVVHVSEDAIRIAVEECYFHCGKALIRSEFWHAVPNENTSTSNMHFVAASRFLVLATIDADGCADVSPKGDPAGAMAQLDEKSLWFADRPGNKRIDSFRNILTQPRVAVALVIPGTDQVMLVSGLAKITDDQETRSQFAVQEKIPELVTGIGDLVLQLRKSPALARANIWPAPPAPEHINAAKIGIGHIKLNKSEEAKQAADFLSAPGVMEQALAKDYKNNLY